MKNTVKLVLAAGALVLGVQQNQAVAVGPFRDAITMNTIVTGATPATGTFNIVTAGAGVLVTETVYPDFGNAYADIGGFSPAGQGGTDTATSANASFYFRDLFSDEAAEVVQIQLDATALVNNGVVFNGGFAILGGPANDVNILASITADGKIDFQVTLAANSSDVILDYAILRVNGDRQVGTSVPDGGATAALLGLGMMGIAAVRRKLS